MGRVEDNLEFGFSKIQNRGGGGFFLSNWEQHLGATWYPRAQALQNSEFGGEVPM